MQGSHLIVLEVTDSSGLYDMGLRLRYTDGSILGVVCGALFGWAIESNYVLIVTTAICILYGLSTVVYPGTFSYFVDEWAASWRCRNRKLPATIVVVISAIVGLLIGWSLEFNYKKDVGLIVGSMLQFNYQKDVVDFEDSYSAFTFSLSVGCLVGSITWCGAWFWNPRWWNFPRLNREQVVFWWIVGGLIGSVIGTIIHAGYYPLLRPFAAAILLYSLGTRIGGFLGARIDQWMRSWPEGNMFEGGDLCAITGARLMAFLGALSGLVIGIIPWFQSEPWDKEEMQVHGFVLGALVGLFLAFVLAGWADSCRRSALGGDR